MSIEITKNDVQRLLSSLATNQDPNDFGRLRITKDMIRELKRIRSNFDTCHYSAEDSIGLRQDIKDSVVRYTHTDYEKPGLRFTYSFQMVDTFNAFPIYNIQVEGTAGLFEILVENIEGKLRATVTYSGSNDPIYPVQQHSILAWVMYTETKLFSSDTLLREFKSIIETIDDLGIPVITNIV